MSRGPETEYIRGHTTLLAEGTMSEQIMGKIEVTDAASNVVITLNGLTGDITAGGTGKDGDVVLRDEAGVDRVKIDGRHGTILILDGHLTLADGSGKTRIHIDPGGIELNTHQPPFGQVIGLSAATGRIAAG